MSTPSPFRARRRPRHASAVVAVLGVVLGGLVAGCSAQQTVTPVAESVAASPAGSEVAEVTATVLAEFEPPEAPGYTQYLYRVVIPPGAEIPPHHHPGQQMARIESGTLTYSAIEGTLELGRDSDTPTETVEAPATVEIEPGDSVFEAESLVHEAANEGDEPVVILLSSLLTSGEDLSILEE